MRLVELRLQNFRQFAGEQRLKFAGDTAQNVTLIFGANGSGKTTLLNAFTWVLYGSLSPDLEQSERLVTSHVWRQTHFGAAVTVSVEVHFEHAGDVYRVRREVVTTKASDEQALPPPRLRLWITSADGASEEIGAAQQRLDSILPEQLSRFFFFNGERIEHLVSKSAYAEIKQAIKTLLGLEQVERALEHLPKVERKLNADLRKHGGDRAADIASRIEEARDQQSLAEAKLDEFEAENARLQDERSGVLALLSKHQAAGPLQQQRADGQRQLEQAKASLAGVQALRRKRVAERGFVAFTEAVAEKTSEMADALDKRGELPAPIKRDFVDGLLQAAECICGTPLTGDSAPHLRVKDWRAKAGLAEVEAAWQRLRGDLTRLPEARSDLREYLTQASASAIEDQKRIRELEEQRAELDAEIAKLPMEDVQRLESKRAELDERIAANNRDIGVLRERRQTLAVDVERYMTELRKAEIKDELAARARRRIELVQEVHSALQKILGIRTTSVRADLDRRIKDVFRRITVKPFYPELTSEFELSLVQDIDGSPAAVARSTGENQILSLCFVAAVSELARAYREANKDEAQLLDAGGSFPLVMDAAFGSLDKNYQRDISKALPKMAPQMIVLVSKSQGQGVVLEELTAYTGRYAVVVAHTSNSERDPEMIDLQGRTHPYIDTRSDSDWAEIVEVTA